MLNKKIFEFCERNDVCSQPLALAVSGGADSTFLTHMFALLQKQCSIPRIGVIHLDHGLRTHESKSEYDFVHSLAQKYGFEFHFKKLQGKSLSDPAIEEWARRERYAFFSKIQKQYKYQFIVTGHTANDQAETLLMRIIRGTGISGSCGIKEVRKDNVIRPLLSIERREIINWLCIHSYNWCEDASNQNEKFFRNWMRKKIVSPIIKKYPCFVKHCTDFTSDMYEHAQFIEDLATQWLDRNQIENETSRIIIKKPDTEQSQFICIEAICKIFHAKGLDITRIHRETFKINLLRNSGTFLLPSGWRYFPTRHTIELCHLQFFENEQNLSKLVEHISIPSHQSYTLLNGWLDVSISSSENSLTKSRVENKIQFDGDLIGSYLSLRKMQTDDTFLPRGRNKPIYLRHYLKKLNRNKHERFLQRVCTTEDGEIIWLPGIAINHNYTATDKTTKVVNIIYRKK